MRGTLIYRFSFIFALLLGFLYKDNIECSSFVQRGKEYRQYEDDEGCCTGSQASWECEEEDCCSPLIDSECYEEECCTIPQDCWECESEECDLYESNCCEDEKDCCSILSNFNLYSYYSFGKSPGICKNYGGTGLFYTPSFCLCSFGPIFDASGVYFENCHYGASVGAGIRVMRPNCCSFGGAAVYYDFRKGKVDCFHQIGASLELIGNCIEFRANAYIPLNNKVKKSPTIFFEYDNTGVSSPYVASAYLTEFPLTGADAELGVRCCWSGSFAAYIGVGPYYYNHKCDLDFWGVQGHVRLEYGRFVAVQGQATWDDEFKTQGRVQLEINIPFSVFCNICDFFCCPLNYQRRVFRDPTVHLRRSCRYTTNY